MGALDMGRDKEVFFRAMISPKGSKGSATGFFFMTLRYSSWMDAKGGYERYRQMRAFYLQSYAQALLMKNKHLEQIVGLAMEPPGNNGSSEDIIYAEQTQWTLADRKQVRNDCLSLGIMANLERRSYRGQEYPQANQPLGVTASGNSTQAARKRKQ
jgi:hypothetical protein